MKTSLPAEPFELSESTRKSLESKSANFISGNVSSPKAPEGDHKEVMLDKVAIKLFTTEDAQMDVVNLVQDMVLTNGEGASLTLSQKRAIAMKLSFWTKVFYSKGAIEFQELFEEKARKLAQAKLEGSHLIVPAKFGK